MTAADISVVIPYHNEAKTLPTTLDLIGRQTLPPREVFFVNSSSTDDSSRIIDAWIKENQPRLDARLRNVFEGTNTPSSSKNVGIRRAASAWIAFMDCGQMFPVDWLQRQWDYAAAHPEVDVVSGGCLFVGDGLIDMSAVAQTYGYKRFLPSVPTTLVKKSVFDKTGLFLENRRAGYDYAWALLLKKMGIKRCINEGVVIRYIGANYADSLGNIFKKIIAYAAPTVGMPHYYIPYYYLTVLAVALCACALRPASVWFFLAAHILFRGYFYPLKKAKDFSLIKEHPLALLTLPLVGIVLDAGRTLGILKGVFLISTRRREP